MSSNELLNMTNEIGFQLPIPQAHVHFFPFIVICMYSCPAVFLQWCRWLYQQLYSVTVFARKLQSCVVLLHWSWKAPVCVSYMRIAAVKAGWQFAEWRWTVEVIGGEVRGFVDVAAEDVGHAPEQTFAVQVFMVQLYITTSTPIMFPFPRECQKEKHNSVVLGSFRSS